jgi:magnesium chelatase family protein
MRTRKRGAREIKHHYSVNDDAEKLLETAINKLGLSARAYSRVLKVSRTIGDVAGSEHIEAAHMAEAIEYRSSDRRSPYWQRTRETVPNGHRYQRITIATARHALLQF